MRILVVSGLILALAAGCQQDKSKLTGMGSAMTANGSSSSAGSAATTASPGGPVEDIDSKDILARTETAPQVTVKHVLIGWKDLSAQHDPRAAKRTNAEAAALAKEIYGKLKANPDQIDELVKQYSEDPGSLKGDPYTVKADTPFVPEFKKLALRLKEKEVGIVKTQFGYHVIERVLPPPPDPLESKEILARPQGDGPVYVQHMVIGWKDAPQKLPGNITRTKADADKLAQEVLAKIAAKEDMTKLIKESSDEPDAKDKPQQAVEIAKTTPILDEFKSLALRLNMDEAGMIKTPFGWLIMKRVAPPPPDPLESVDILKREPATQKAKVKHILLGWTEVHAEDERGKKRSRADLEKLVKGTVAKLKGGAKIEPLMKQLSEDPGSAQNGQSYDVTPDAGLVPPFKNLSLRLKVGEVGVVKTEFGIHIIQRVE
ncbi:MAG: peptidylprolyl isomerase [Acidobacteriota bacterium]